MLGSFGDAFRLPDLKRRILFTLGVLFVFRLGAHIPTPGVDRAAMAQLFGGNNSGVLDFLNLFSGGALQRFSIFSLGVAPYIRIVTRTDESGRIYPYSEQGAQVRDVLSVHAFASADVFLGDAAEHISSSDGLVTNSVETDSTKAAGKNKRKGFTVIMKSGRIIKTRTVILALGGKAGPQYGCTGDGYRLARNLGHRVTRLAPALSAVECKGAFKPIKGVRAKARVQLLKKIKMSGERLQDGKGRVIKNESNDVIAEESGEVQFTADGLSGICIFDLSRFIKLYDSETLDDGFKKYSLRVDLMPDISEDALREMLNEKIKIFSRRITENNAKRVIQCSHLKNKNASKKYNTQFKEKWCVLETIVNDKLAKMIFERVTDNMGTDKMYPNMIDVRSERAESFYAKEPVKLAKALASGIKDMRFQVSSVKGWRYAQCTSGGILRVEVDMSTMESKTFSKLGATVPNNNTNIINILITFFFTILSSL